MPEHKDFPTEPIGFETQEAFDLFMGLDPKDPDSFRIISEKGVPVGQGWVDITIEGKPEKMWTGVEDFGTIKVEEPGS